MTKKAVNLLSTKYEKEGFAMLVEGSEVDLYVTSSVYGLCRCFIIHVTFPYLPPVVATV